MTYCNTKAIESEWVYEDVNDDILSYICVPECLKKWTKCLKILNKLLHNNLVSVCNAVTNIVLLFSAAEVTVV